MKRQEFYYDLPHDLIAQTPLDKRSASRLMCVSRQNTSFSHKRFDNILDMLEPNDLLVLNNSKVIPARLFGHKLSGGKLEMLIERVLDEHTVLTHIRASKAPKADSVFELNSGIEFQVLSRQDDLFVCRCLSDRPVIDILHEQGKLPLPPYIEREVEDNDLERYQTVYAEHEGSVAAPTAGLHFDDELLAAIKQRGIETAMVTLHVGAGTFQPVREDDIKNHKMHHEYLDVSQEAVDKILTAKQHGGRVIAVGTTSVRSLETAAMSGELQAFAGDSDIFIYPGYEFRVVDAMITNFHLPESTLLMLVSAFIGKDKMMAAYKTAIEEGYRFFSYGDAMFLS